MIKLKPILKLMRVQRLNPRLKPMLKLMLNPRLKLMLKPMLNPRLNKNRAKAQQKRKTLKQQRRES